MTKYAAFAQLLHDLMVKKGLNASDVAREMWGTKKDKRGYDGAKNRDRIGAYLSGTSFPETPNLKKLAKALGVPFDRLFATRPPPVVRIGEATRKAPDARLRALELELHELRALVIRLIAEQAELKEHFDLFEDLTNASLDRTRVQARIRKRRQRDRERAEAN